METLVQSRGGNGMIMGQELTKKAIDRAKEVLKELDILNSKISKIGKTWPDTIEEMKDQYWGFHVKKPKISSPKYIVVTSGPAGGYIVKADGTWCTIDVTNEYLQNTPVFNEEYEFIQFPTAKALYRWLAE